MFGELLRVFNEVNEFLAPVSIEYHEEQNTLTKVLFKAQYLHLPHLDMSKFDYNLNNLMILKDFYDYPDYPKENAVCLAMAHNLAVLFLKLRGTTDYLKSDILNSSMTCEELEKDLAKKDPYATLLLYKGFKQSPEFRKIIMPEEILRITIETNRKLVNLKVIDAPLMDFNRHFRRYFDNKSQAGKQLTEKELETRKLLEKYFIDENTPRPEFELNPYTEESGIILE